MLKNLIKIIIVTFLLNSCGYTPMYSKKDIDKNFNIELLSFEGDRDINNVIKYSFKRHNNKNDELKVSIKTKTDYKKNIGTKNLAGDTQTYNLSATATFEISYGEIQKIFRFTENSKMENTDSQLDDATYETSIKKNFGIRFYDRLILQLTKIK